MDKPTCSIDGCERTHKARGFCEMHYQRWKRHGSTADPKRAADLKFKKCSRCALTLAIERFTRRSDRDTRHSWCKGCVSTYMAGRYKESGYDRDRAASYYRKNREHALAVSAAWAAANRDRRSEYKSRRRGKALTTPPIPRCAVEARMSYFGYRCWMCGGVGDSVDHVKPLNKGGPHMLSNLRPACKPCNSGKRDRWYGVANISNFIRN